MARTEPKSRDLGKTQIAEKIRVSSAAIYYPADAWGERWQYETWIFSEDPRQRSRMVIHGSSSTREDLWLVAKTRLVHAHIARNMLARFGAPEAVSP